jgi:nicotinate-nucleotide adenylyltransferase
MGGTFDPIHLGHLRAAEMARESLGLTQVLFVPVGKPPHRRPVASAHDRHAMVGLAIADHPDFEVSDIEVRRNERSYTVDTLEELKRLWKDELVLIVGSDTLREMPSWHEAERIFAGTRIAVIERSEECVAGQTEAPAAVERIAGTGLDIAATFIRAQIAKGLSVRYLVPPSAVDYIAEHRLYA